MNLPNNPVVLALIGAVSGWVGNWFINRKSSNENISSERKAMIEQYGDPFEKLNKALDEKDKLIEEKNEATKKCDNIQNKYSSALIKIEQLERQLDEANKNINELLQTIKELKGETA